VAPRGTWRSRDVEPKVIVSVFDALRIGTRLAARQMTQLHRLRNPHSQSGGFMYPTSHAIPFGLSAQWPFAPIGNPAAQPQQYGQPFQQIVQVLQMVPQQLQQLQQLQYAQHQQLQHVQQLLQAVPAQIAQLQQLIQIVPYQIQQLQQQSQQPFVTSSGLSSFGATPFWSIGSPGLGQPGQVM
jgi:hypothetical protein